MQCLPIFELTRATVSNQVRIFQTALSGHMNISNELCKQPINKF